MSKDLISYVGGVQIVILQFVAEWPKGFNRRIAVALSKSEKEKIVGEVKEVASNASSLVISDARGLKVSELSEVRQKATQAGIHIQVIKNKMYLMLFLKK